MPSIPGLKDNGAVRLGIKDPKSVPNGKPREQHSANLQSPYADDRCSSATRESPNEIVSPVGGFLVSRF